MFLGHAGTLPLLQAFLAGTTMPCSKPEEPSFANFNAWLAARIEDVSDSHNLVLRWLDEELGSQKAFAAYFNYLDEFRANEVEVLQINAGPLTPRFTHGDGSAPSVPARLVVGRFSPSDIYFWGTQSETDQEMGFPFCHSVVKAKKLAAERWDTPPRTWRKLEPPKRLRTESSPGLWDLLERVRQRPGMYCDPANQPLAALETMLSGYEAALEDHNVPDEGRGFNAAFRSYLLVRFGWSTSCGWAAAIREHLEDGEDELGRLFGLADELRSVAEAVSEDLDAIGARLEDIYRRHGIRRRRRDWIVKQLGASESPRARRAD